MSYTATAYGLNFRLPFPCPELPPGAPGAAGEISVEEGPVPRQLAGAPFREGHFDAEPGRFLLRCGPRAGRFLIENGAHITFHRGPHSEERIVAFQFLHSVMAALLHQRGCLVLHANAVLVDGGATVISGESGAGKSTLIAELAARGFPMLSDDVTALRVASDGGIEAIPGPRLVHLCDDAARKVGPRVSSEADLLPRDSWHRMKVGIPVAGDWPEAPAPFRRWAVLSIGGGDRVRVRSLSGLDKLRALQNCQFMPMRGCERAERFALLSAVMERIPLVSVERPEGQWTMDGVVKAVLGDGG